MRSQAGAGWLLLLLLAACGSDRLAEVDLDLARAAATSVEAGNLMPWVRRLAEGHAADVKVSCLGYEALELYPACELSRDSGSRP